MSLLEDIFDLLQNVLEYFGVSPDMVKKNELHITNAVAQFIGCLF
ncbi:unnamed protein product [Oncorhynchus mykiss]|uniref:Uncharacterized protein n=1 Tax=Oncorhynchus mykiss TaxID=8022 RepID=A0A060ZA55_ONCMY|nr:unnamed protein product [Oncorhynchus mykiss]